MHEPFPVIAQTQLDFSRILLLAACKFYVVTFRIHVQIMGNWFHWKINILKFMWLKSMNFWASRLIPDSIRN